MSSQRPVYIPRRRKTAAATATATGNNDNVPPADSSAKRQPPFQKRQKQIQPRFHGAFTGGFSAGHFNTVGTKEGWTPSETKIRDQKLEDFMDEEDHADWGGPTRLREAYEPKAAVATTASYPTGSLLPLQSMLEVSHETVGPRLLRRLGWREGGTAIVREQEHTALGMTQSSATVTGDKETDDIDLAKVHLSKRRLRKIKLQSSRITKLPPPKLDQCGLGFEPYKDAPEFQRYREQRRQQAKERASYDTSTKGRNVYRLADIAGASGSDGGDGAAELSRPRPREQTTANAGNSDYLSYETAEDFVGKRSAAGFALRDDEDDAYDEERTPNNRRGGGIEVGEEYNTEVYEHIDSDDDDDDNYNEHTASSLLPATGDAGDVFAAWAGADPSRKGKEAEASAGSKSTMPGSKPSDGRTRALGGFVVGDSIDTSKKRYAGPDIPRNYTIQRHKFGEHETPYVLEAISNAVRLQQKEERTFRVQQQQVQHQAQQRSATSDRPLTKNFTSLADAMKSRFTSESSAKQGSSTTESTTAFPAGLHLPNPVQAKTDSTGSVAAGASRSANANAKHASEIAIQRTVRSFVPNPLVCKRFRVPMPSSARLSNALVAADSATTKNKESIYFEREILQKAREQAQTNNTQASRSEAAAAKDSDALEVDASATQDTNRDDDPEDHRTGIDRPSIERLRSIFDASSEEFSSSEDEDDERRASANESKTEDKASECAERDSSRFKPSLTETRDDARNDRVVGNGDSSRAIVEYQHPALTTQDGNGDDSSGTSTDGDDDDDDDSSRRRRRKRDRRHRKHDRHRKRYKRKRSRSNDRDKGNYSSNEEDERGREKERRRYKDKRKKKKKSLSSSSRHRSRKREKSEDR
eukprot:jgi/Psemu1/223681/e_gw1.1369.2.1